MKITNAAAALGRLGGQSKSKAKVAAAKRNGKLGGWPKGKKRKLVDDIVIGLHKS